MDHGREAEEAGWVEEDLKEEGHLRVCILKVGVLLLLVAYNLIRKITWFNVKRIPSKIYANHVLLELKKKINSIASAFSHTGSLQLAQKGLEGDSL